MIVTFVFEVNRGVGKYICLFLCILGLGIDGYINMVPGRIVESCQGGVRHRRKVCLVEIVENYSVVFLAHGV